MIKRVQNLWGRFRQTLTLIVIVLLVVFITLLLLAPETTGDFIGSISGILRLFVVGSIYAYLLRYMEQHYHLRAWWQSQRAKRAGQVKPTTPEVRLAAPSIEKSVKPSVIQPEVSRPEAKIVPPPAIQAPNQEDDDDEDSEFWNMLRETANRPASSTTADEA